MAPVGSSRPPRAAAAVAPDSSGSPRDSRRQGRGAAHSGPPSPQARRRAAAAATPAAPRPAPPTLESVAPLSPQQESTEEVIRLDDTLSPMGPPGQEPALGLQPREVEWLSNANELLRCADELAIGYTHASRRRDVLAEADVVAAGCRGRKLDEVLQRRIRSLRSLSEHQALLAAHLDAQEEQLPMVRQQASERRRAVASDSDGLRVRATRLAEAQAQVADTEQRCADEASARRAELRDSEREVEEKARAASELEAERSNQEQALQAGRQALAAFEKQVGAREASLRCMEASWGKVMTRYRRGAAMDRAELKAAASEQLASDLLRDDAYLLRLQRFVQTLLLGGGSRAAGAVPRHRRGDDEARRQHSPGEDDLQDEEHSLGDELSTASTDVADEGIDLGEAVEEESPLQWEATGSGESSGVYCEPSTPSSRPRTVSPPPLMPAPSRARPLQLPVSPVVRQRSATPTALLAASPGRPPRQAMTPAPPPRRTSSAPPGPPGTPLRGLSCHITPSSTARGGAASPSSGYLPAVAVAGLGGSATAVAGTASVRAALSPGPRPRQEQRQQVPPSPVVVAGLSPRTASVGRAPRSSSRCGTLAAGSWPNLSVIGSPARGPGAAPATWRTVFDQGVCASVSVPTSTSPQALPTGASMSPVRSGLAPVGSSWAATACGTGPSLAAAASVPNMATAGVVAPTAVATMAVAGGAGAQTTPRGAQLWHTAQLQGSLRQATVAACAQDLTARFRSAIPTTSSTSTPVTLPRNIAVSFGTPLQAGR